MKVQFCDFWAGFDPHDNFWTQVFNKLKISYKVVNDDSDLLISSCFGSNFLNKRSNKKMYWTGENWYRMSDRLPSLGAAIIDLFDQVYSFDLFDSPNHFRLPLYLVDTIESDIDDFNKVLRLKSKSQLEREFKNRKFCTFVQSNPNSQFRNNFFNQLNLVDKVDSYGPLFNNTKMIINRSKKIEITKNYKFQLAFENSKYEGYITEKIIDALKSDVIPIYWGGDNVKNEFNEKSFINVNTLGVDDSLRLISEMKIDFELYWQYYNKLIISAEQTSLKTRIDDFYNNLKNFIDKI